MISVVGKRTQHHVKRGSILTTATFVVRNRHHPINVWILLTVVEQELRHHRDLLSFMAGTHTRRHDQHIIASANPAVRTAKTLESCTFCGGNVIGWRR